MAFFKQNGEKESYFSAATIVTHGTTNIGNFIGNDSIHIDGNIEGDIKVNNVVIVGRSGVVNGHIKAQQVISSGQIKGNILCDSLELLESSKTNGHAKANKILLKGDIKGNIVCGGLFMSKDAFVESTVQAKNIVADGTITGIMACRVLKIMPTSFIKGNMFADRIINKGGHVEGFIGKYKDLVVSNPQLSRYSTIFNSENETLLLQYSDYHVDVEDEIENRNSPKSKKDIEDDFCIDVEFDESDARVTEVSI